MEGKTLSLILITMAGVVCGPWLDGFTKPAQATVTGANLDVGFFYDRLAPYGDWRQHARWGWVWSPHDVAADWRPYTVGHWVYTDDYGWLWESDEDWGWACYHYGRWDWDDDFGWFWVPGSYWGPAWVAWRTGPDFIGWCPLPPPVRWQPGFGLAFNGVDLDDLPPWRWVFIEATFFDFPRLHDHIFLVSRNVILVRETRPFVRFDFIDGRIVNRAFTVREIEVFTHRPVTHFRVRRVDSPAAMRVFREREGEIAVFNPRIRRGPTALVPPGPREWERRQGAERAQLQERQRAEQLRQQERFRTERAQTRSGPPDRGGAGAEQLQRRQEAERQALQAEHGRQQRFLENRQMRQREEFGAPQARAEAFGRPGRLAGVPGQGRGMRR